LYPFNLDKLEISLVDKGSRVECVSTALMPELAAGDSPEFVVDQGNKLVQSLPVTIAPGDEEFGDADPYSVPLILRSAGPGESFDLVR
jgi:hypothetical protein